MRFLRKPGDVAVNTEPGIVAVDTEPSNVAVDTAEPANMEVDTAEPLKKTDYSITSFKKSLSTLTSFIQTWFCSSFFPNWKRLELINCHNFSFLGITFFLGIKILLCFRIASLKKNLSTLT